MRHKDIAVGASYSAKVSGRVVALRVLRIERVALRDRHVTRYICRNATTGRDVVVKSAARFQHRLLAPISAVTVSPDGPKAA